MLAGAVFVVVLAAIGVGLTLLVDVPLRLEERLPLGVVTGVLAVSAGAFVGFELFGMGWAALGTGSVAAGAPAGLGWARHHDRVRREAARARRRLGLPARHAASLRPLAAFTVLTTAVTTRILALAYQRDGDGLAAGNLAVWGDWAAHLAYAGSFAYGDNRDLRLPVASGEGFRYHLLADFTGSLFTVPGLGLPQALVWSAWLVALTVPPLMVAVVLRLTGSRRTAIVAVVLFALTGGVGAWYAWQDVRRGGVGVLNRLPQTYARMPDRGIWLDNTISASLYAQRSTLFGVATGLAAAVLLLAARPRWSRSGFLAAGLLVGTTGISHVHLLLSALALGGLAWVVDRRSTWLWFLTPAAVIGLPLVWAIRPPTSRMRWLPGWMAPQVDQGWPWFWVRNAGLLLPLFLALALLGGGSPRLRRLTAPLWLWFVVPNLVAFHPWEGNNTKFFLFWQFGACLVIADALRRLVDHPRARQTLARSVGAFALAALVIGSLTVTGGLDAVRAMQRSSRIAWVDDDDLAAARWLRAHAQPGDVLAYGATNTSAVAALGGVPALTGYPGWTDDLGLPDAFVRVNANRTILAGGDEAPAMVRRYGVDWVAIGPRERAELEASDAYWREHGELAFSQGDHQIYAVP